MKEKIYSYTGSLRSHALSVPESIYKASGIIVFGRRIKSLVFSTDIAIIKNINTDAILAVYPFTPQASIAKSIISVSDVPAFLGVGGGMTAGERTVRMAEDVELHGGFGVVVNAPMPPEVIAKIKEQVELPVITTVVSEKQNYADQISAGTDILNVSAAGNTANVVTAIRERYPDMPIIATGGPTDSTIEATIQAGANAITYTPPTNGELFSAIMQKHRDSLINM